MNAQAKLYMQALVAFTQAATRATHSVQALYTPERPRSTDYVFHHLSRFGEQLRTALTGLDKDFVKMIRRLYDAHTINLLAGYQAFYTVQSSRNPCVRASDFAAEAYDSAERSHQKSLAWAIEVTQKTISVKCQG